MADLANLRQQILPTYLTDKNGMDKLVNEAFLRSQKDIHIAHIFISFTHNGQSDSAAAARKLAEVQNKLKANVPFAEVASAYSDDPSARRNNGDLGWISVFTLPYELENIVYTTAPGKNSSPYTSRVGYHIFRNLGERKSLGRMKTAQILLAFPPGTDEAGKQQIKKLADSLYNRIQKGDDFGKLASQFSNDIISAAANGQMQEFGIGEFDPAFENAAFGLSKDGAVGKPVLTAHGYHIVKRLKKIEVPVKKDDKTLMSLRDKVEQSDRILTTRRALAQKVLNTAPLKNENYRQEDLWFFSDSIINYRTGGAGVSMSHSTPLFQIGDKEITAGDWVNYAQAFRYRPDGGGVKPYPVLWEEFVQNKAIEYYESHLEDYNTDFRNQINEFREGNLFFEIMQRKVWGPAQTDSVALADYYNRHRNDYSWKQSADAVIFYATDVSSAKTFSTQLKKSPKDWRELVMNYSEKIAADSSRFELGQIPNPAHLALKPGMITDPFINKSDNTASFAYIIRNYPNPEPRSFAEARGLVINDYQTELEKSWIQELKQKYPVRINDSEVEGLVKGKKY